MKERGHAVLNRETLHSRGCLAKGLRTRKREVSVSACSWHERGIGGQHASIALSPFLVASEALNTMLPGGALGATAAKTLA